ncbi:ABC transporter substrate-binding protein [Brucella abortus]|nr:ABC transporter substrate-binding protein [Brucella abortus]
MRTRLSPMPRRSVTKSSTRPCMKSTNPGLSPYVAKIQAANVDTVFTGNWSNDLLRSMKAASGAGLKAKFATSFLDQPAISAMRARLPKGISFPRRSTRRPMAKPAWLLPRTIRR